MCCVSNQNFRYVIISLAIEGYAVYDLAVPMLLQKLPLNMAMRRYNQQLFDKHQAIQVFACAHLSVSCQKYVAKDFHLEIVP